MSASRSSIKRARRRGGEYPTGGFKTRIAAEVPDKNDTIHVYCNVGRQSGQAQQLLSEMGYTQVVNAGGLSEIASRKAPANNRWPRRSGANAIY